MHGTNLRPSAASSALGKDFGTMWQSVEVPTPVKAISESFCWLCFEFTSSSRHEASLKEFLHASEIFHVF